MTKAWSSRVWQCARPSQAFVPIAILVGIGGLSCGKTSSSGGEGQSQEGSGAASSSGGMASTRSGGAGGAADDDGDCSHPEVVENCEGDFCRIEPGCFIMGAPLEEFGRARVNSDPVQVTLTRPFWMGRTEVTCAQWEAAGLEQPEVRWVDGERECLEPECPQGSVSFYRAMRYANRLSEMEGLAPCYLVDEYECDDNIVKGASCAPVSVNGASPYECEGYRLPMEAEWEYAARGGTTTAFFTGEITEQTDAGGCYRDVALDAIGWYCMNSPEQTQPVAQKLPNPWGLFDMHGNAWEPVNDLYGPSGYLTGPYAPSEGPLVDPTGAVNPPDLLTATEEHPYRALRGGSHIGSAVTANVSRRFSASSKDSGVGTSAGLRIVRTIFE